MKVCILNYDLVNVNSDPSVDFREDVIQSIVGMSDWFEATEEECYALSKDGYMVVKHIDYQPALNQVKRMIQAIEKLYGKAKRKKDLDNAT